MGVKATLNMKAFEDYLERIAAMGNDLNAAVDQALMAGAEVALAGMRARVPVDSGNLSGNLRSSGVKAEGNYRFIEVGLVGANAETTRYGVVQEYGSSSVKAHPYIRPTMDEDKGRIRAAMRNQLKGFLSGK